MKMKLKFDLLTQFSQFNEDFLMISFARKKKEATGRLDYPYVLRQKINKLLLVILLQLCKLIFVWSAKLHFDHLYETF